MVLTHCQMLQHFFETSPAIQTWATKLHFWNSVRAGCCNSFLSHCSIRPVPIGNRSRLQRLQTSWASHDRSSQNDQRSKFIPDRCHNSNQNYPQQLSKNEFDPSSSVNHLLPTSNSVKHHRQQSVATDALDAMYANSSRIKAGCVNLDGRPQLYSSDVDLFL